MGYKPRPSAYEFVTGVLYHTEGGWVIEEEGWVAEEDKKGSGAAALAVA